MKTLKFTTTPPAFMGIINPDNVLVRAQETDKVISSVPTKGNTAYIHGEAESLAGFDIPVMLDGDLAQLDKPEEEQDILMVLPDGSYPIKAIWEPNPSMGQQPRYLLVLKGES